MCENVEKAKECMSPDSKGILFPPRVEHVEFLDVATLDSLPTEEWTSYVHPPTLDRIRGRRVLRAIYEIPDTARGKGSWITGDAIRTSTDPGEQPVNSDTRDDHV